MARQTQSFHHVWLRKKYPAMRLSLRIDAQGKGLGQALLEMEIDVPESLVAEMRVKEQR